MTWHTFCYTKGKLQILFTTLLLFHKKQAYIPTYIAHNITFNVCGYRTHYNVHKLWDVDVVRSKVTHILNCFWFVLFCFCLSFVFVFCFVLVLIFCFCFSFYLFVCLFLSWRVLNMYYLWWENRIKLELQVKLMETQYFLFVLELYLMQKWQLFQIYTAMYSLWRTWSFCSNGDILYIKKKKIPTDLTYSEFLKPYLRMYNLTPIFSVSFPSSLSFLCINQELRLSRTRFYYIASKEGHKQMPQ